VELKGQARRGADRRQAILEAATEVFARRGFRSGGLAEVAEAVNVSPANILYHFGSKEALLLAVIEYRDQRAQFLGADLWPNSDSDVLDSLLGLVRFAEMAEAEPGLAMLHTVLQIENLDPADLAYEYFQQRTQRAQRWVTSLLDTAQANGSVRADVDTEAKGREIIAFLEGAAVLWLLNRQLSIKDLYINYLNGVVNDLSVKRPTKRLHRPRR
jgi:AcrR family transcriptional regulator